MSKQECADACSAYGSKFMGMQWTSECWCGNVDAGAGERTWTGYERLGEYKGTPDCDWNNDFTQVNHPQTGARHQYGPWVNCVFEIDPVPPPAPPVEKPADFVACKDQERFDIVMCQSHECNNCILGWCMKACQAIQTEFPTCRCGHWPESRKEFSTGGIFKGAGNFGDTGDYGTMGATVSL